jgi:divalent metal cation (Fe/Co/Zn/Cd) transporter
MRFYVLMALAFLIVGAVLACASAGIAVMAGASAVNARGFAFQGLAICPAICATSAVASAAMYRRLARVA